MAYVSNAIGCQPAPTPEERMCAACYESLSLDYDARRIYRLQVRALFEEARRACFKAAWARYRAGGELSIWTV